jgi:hypothetical protein
MMDLYDHLGMMNVTITSQKTALILLITSVKTVIIQDPT